MNGKLYSFDKLKEIAQDDDAFVQEMITTFIDTVSEEVTNIERLMDTDEWKAIGGIAHKLASNYAYMDSESLYALSANIEIKIKSGCDFIEIAAMARQMCADSLLLIAELRKINNDKNESVDL